MLWVGSHLGRREQWWLVKEEVCFKAQFHIYLCPLDDPEVAAAWLLFTTVLWNPTVTAGDLVNVQQHRVLFRQCHKLLNIRWYTERGGDKDFIVSSWPCYISGWGIYWFLLHVVMIWYYIVNLFSAYAPSPLFSNICLSFLQLLLILYILNPYIMLLNSPLP